MRILFTGAAGYLGRAMILPFENRGHFLRLMDVYPFEAKHETFVGSVADLQTVRNAVQSMEAIVIAHMAKNPDAYVDPTLPFDVNVKGTANLFFAAQECGIKKVVLISSTSACDGHDIPSCRHDLPPRGKKGLYCVTKACQEIIAEQFSREFGMSVAALRPSYVMDSDSLLDKYGHKVGTRHAVLSDRRDIGEVARLCLQRDDIQYEVFNVMSTDASLKELDVAHTCQRLGWKPRYKFESLPLPGREGVKV